MIQDSGERREFKTGAVRDIQEGKGRCDLMPLDVVACLLYEDPVINQIYFFTEDGNPEHLFCALRFATGGYGYLYENIPDMLLQVSKHFEEGAAKYGECNWQKGIPVHSYIDSALRHYLKYKREDYDEPHDRAFVWNILCLLWTLRHKPEMNDLKKETE